eukprot:CAMPEP_0117480326 /NCGR_PEP_ID=MMETSP0784-20121206/12335_1 /TAXON_ID=39447 /ORGANISM="" /LENGTH=388 /DNA_ID=CAMNT_0005274765 /DNA_START=358 /DNA_END=1525 /DNA_ORIENTATION=-
MDDARALLDSLMGQARNAGKEERKKKKRGESFKDDTVCKFQLVGFCPEHEDLFHNTKRDIGECRKTHFEISKEEFDNHPEKARYKAEYETLLLRHLEAHVRRADDWAAKERQKNELASQKQAELGGNEVARQEIDKLNDMAGKLYAEAENLASAGKVELSKAKVLLAEQLQKKKADWEAKARDAPAAEVCEVCGLTKENDAGAEKGNKFTHTEGKVHQGFLLIRKWYAELREKQKRGELDIKANTSRDSREDSDRRQQKKHGEARAEDESNQKSDVGRDGREADRRREQESAAGAAGTTATMGGGAVSVRTTVTAEGMMEMAAATTAGAGAPAKMMRMATPRRRGGAVVAGRWTRADLSRETADTAVSTIALTVDDPGGVIKGFDIHR